MCKHISNGRDKKNILYDAVIFFFLCYVKPCVKFSFYFTSSMKSIFKPVKALHYNFSALLRDKHSNSSSSFLLKYMLPLFYQQYHETIYIHGH